MPVLTAPQTAAMQRAIAAANNVLPKLELLEQIAAINPAIAQRVRELRAQREYLMQLASTALELDRQVSGASWSPPPPPSYSPPPPSYSPPPPPMSPPMSVSAPLIDPVTGTVVGAGGQYFGNVGPSGGFWNGGPFGGVQLPAALYTDPPGVWKVQGGQPSNAVIRAARDAGKAIISRDFGNGMGLIWYYESDPR